MQIVCERLYKVTKAQTEEGADWIIGELDYRGLGKIEGQIENYIEDTLTRFVATSDQGKKLGAREKFFEIERWKWLLTKLAITQYDGTAVTRLVREDKLRKLHAKYHCKISFDAMIKHLSDEDQRIVRRPVKAMDKETRLMANFYSLGHDALALALVNFRNSQDEMRKKGGALETFVTNLLRVVFFVLLAFPVAVGVLMLIFALTGKNEKDMWQISLVCIGAIAVLGPGLWHSPRIAALLVSRRAWMRD
jgi:hypothetical protein